MVGRRECGRRAARAIAILAAALSLTFAALPAHAGNVVLGGPYGVVKSSKGDTLEGIMVQLIAAKSAVRTTVFSNAEGRYEFPKLDSGSYVLRIARPREFHPFVQEDVAIEGATSWPTSCSRA